MNLCFDIGPLRDMVTGAEWYGDLRREVESSSASIVVTEGQYRTEIKKVVLVGRWLIEMDRQGRVKNLPIDDVNKCIAEIVSHPQANCSECDDHHLFSMCYVGRAKYLFTQDDRLAKCRKKMKPNNKLKKFCSVKIVHDEKTYKNHRGRMV